MIRNMKLFHTVKPATVWIAWAGPLIAASPVFEPNSAARRARWAGVL